MNKDKLESILFNVVKNEDNRAKRDEPFDYGFINHGQTVLLNEEVLTSISECIDIIRDYEYFQQYWSYHEIEELVKDIISEGFSLDINDRENYIKNRIGSLKEEMKEEIKEFIIQVPIYNLKIEDEITFGEVKFFIFDEEKQKSFLEKYNDEKILFYTEPNLNNTMAEIKTKGTRYYAFYSAISTINLTINCLKLFLPKNESKFKVKGTINESTDLSYFIFDNDDEDYIFLNRKYVNVFYETEINNSLLNIEELKFIDNLLNKKTTPFEDSLLVAISFYGESLSSYNEDEKYLTYKKSKSKVKNYEYYNLSSIIIKLFSSLESILVFDSNEPITENLSDRVALLLGNDYNSRIKIKRDIKSLYGLRSKHVHEANSFIGKDDLEKLINYTMNVLIKIINLMNKEGIDSPDKLREYFNRIKFD